MAESIRSKVREILSDGEWHTGLELCIRLGARYATGMMSFVRKLRRPEFGGHQIDCEYSKELSQLHGRQIYRYRVRKDIPGKDLDSREPSRIVSNGCEGQP